MEELKSCLLFDIDKDCYSYNLEKFLSKFKKLFLLNNGGFGKIYSVVDNDKNNCVMKIIKKNKFFQHDYNNEINILKLCKNNKYISQIYNYYTDDKYVIIIMEYIKGIELFEHINIARLSEKYLFKYYMRYHFYIN